MAEELREPLTVGCECGRWIGVVPGQAGNAVSCGCGRRVVVPLLDEFRERPDLLSATTIERRIDRLLVAGELPPTGECARCGEVGAEDVVRIRLDCERYTARSGGGERFLVLPLVSLLVWVWWREEEWVEIRGRDTDVAAPLCLCTLCRRYFRGRPGWAYSGLAGLAVAAGFLAGLADVVCGIGVGMAGVFGVALWRGLGKRSRQREVKRLLSRVPAYRQVLARYPRAAAVLPPE